MIHLYIGNIRCLLSLFECICLFKYCVDDSSRLPLVLQPDRDLGQLHMKVGAQSSTNTAFNLPQRYSGTHLLLGEQWTFSGLGQIGIWTCYRSYRSPIPKPLDRASQVGQKKIEILY